MLRDAALSALVAFGLFGPMIGLKTEVGVAAIELTYRPIAVLIAVALVFFGRLGLLAWKSTRPVAKATQSDRKGQCMHSGR